MVWFGAGVAAGCAAAPPATRIPADAGSHDGTGSDSCGTSFGPQNDGSTLALDASLPDLHFSDESGASVSLTSLAAPCAERAAHLLVLRVVTGWCGTCRWHAAHTRETLPEGAADAIRVVDVLVADDDNAPSATTSIASWRSRGDGFAEVFADAAFQLRPLFPARAALPLVALVDSRSMVSFALLSDPDPDVLTNSLRSGLARVGQVQPPSAAAHELVDGRFNRKAWDMIQDMTLVAPPPPDPSNRVADDLAAAALGKMLFFDKSLSPAGVSCSSCHDPSLLFTDGKNVAPEGVGPGSRNVPSMVLASYQRWELWDGRADSLWMQALLPIEDPSEFGSSRLFAVHAIADRYADAYEAIFGPLPPLATGARFPPSGKPGEPAWDSLDAGDQALVTQAFVNAGKSIEAYERSLRALPNALDEYARGKGDALTADQKEGLSAFFAAGCPQCHYGPRLTDDAFHNLRFPTGRSDRTADPGRIAGIPKLLASEFVRSGMFSDAVTGIRSLPVGPWAAGAFKTPGLRGVPFTVPYGHGGSFGGLTSALEAHRTAGLPPDSSLATGEPDPFLVAFDPGLVSKIEAFLATLRLDVSP